MITALADRLGFQVDRSPIAGVAWLELLPAILFAKTAFIVVLAIILHLSLKLPSGFLRTTLGIGGFLSIFGESYVSGRSGLALVDYGMPAFAFLGTLNIVDAFFLRPTSETSNWSIAESATHLFAFPNEQSTSSTPRLENLKAIARAGGKYVIVNILLYFIPSAHNWSLVKPFSLAYFGYSGFVGFAILFTLASVIESVIRLIGVLFGVEMGSNFKNPNGATNIREFWGRWNLAIKNGLSRVFFHFSVPKNTPIPTVIVSDTDRDGSITPEAKEVASESPVVDSDGLRKRLNGNANKTPLNKVSTNAPPKKRVRKPFTPKAISALATFAASGLFHEVCNYFTFDTFPGETVLFFLSHGAATVFYSYLSRYHPKVLRPIPNWVGILLVNGFALATAPLFTGPFLRDGFFDQFKAFGVFGPVDGFVWIFGDGYGGHARK